MGEMSESKKALVNKLKNYNDSVYSNVIQQAQHDKKFERIVQDMTINRMFGGSALSKYKHKV